MKKANLTYLVILITSLFFASCLFQATEEKPVVEEEGDGFDTDGDGYVDGEDNCPQLQNATQADADSDGIGDACELFDADRDGINDDVDNCPDNSNTTQLDSDGDGVGDACEEDSDEDGIPDPMDNCPLAINKLQHDKDNDMKGDICDDVDDTSDIPIPAEFKMTEDIPTFRWKAVEDAEFYSIQVFCLEGCEIYKKLKSSGYIKKSRCYDETTNVIVENSVFEIKYEAGTDAKCPEREIFFPGVEYKARVGAVKDGNRVSFTQFMTFTIAEPLSYDIGFAFDKATNTISWDLISHTPYSLVIQCVTGCAYYSDFDCYDKEKPRLVGLHDDENAIEDPEYTLGDAEACEGIEAFYDGEIYYIGITYLPTPDGVPESKSAYYWHQ